MPVPLSPMEIVELVDDVLEIVNWPDAFPAAVGSNVSVRLRACPGLSLAGRVTAEAEKPVPVTEMEFTVTAAVPLEVSVTVCVVA